nr:protein FAR1-RELATED SEQUENCE 5-like [Ipomoea trifida]
MDVLSCYHHHRPSETRIEASQTGSNKRRLLTETCEYSRKSSYRGEECDCRRSRLENIADFGGYRSWRRSRLEPGLNMDYASGGCDEGYSTDIGVEGSACDMEISPGMTKYWRPNCAEILKPHVGQQFVSLDTAFGFYKQYAGSVGFDCRQSTTRKGRDGGVVLK